MDRIAIVSKDAPKPVGPYSQALRVGPFVFISGQIPLTPDGTMIAPGDTAKATLENETHQVLQNIRALLASVDLDFSDVVKINLFTTDLSQFDTINSVYAQYVSEPYPARAAIEVSALPKGARIEMEAIAYVK